MQCSTLFMFYKCLFLKYIYSEWKSLKNIYLKPIINIKKKKGSEGTIGQK
jgi:hypothetical protein